MKTWPLIKKSFRRWMVQCFRAFFSFQCKRGQASIRKQERVGVPSQAVYVLLHNSFHSHSPACSASPTLLITNFKQSSEFTRVLRFRFKCSLSKLFSIGPNSVQCLSPCYCKTCSNDWLFWLKMKHRLIFLARNLHFTCAFYFFTMFALFIALNYDFSSNRIFHLPNYHSLKHPRSLT